MLDPRPSPLKAIRSSFGILIGNSISAAIERPTLSKCKWPTIKTEETPSSYIKDLCRVGDCFWEITTEEQSEFFLKAVRKKCEYSESSSEVKLIL